MRSAFAVAFLTVFTDIRVLALLSSCAIAALVLRWALSRRRRFTPHAGLPRDSLAKMSETVVETSAGTLPVFTEGPPVHAKIEKFSTSDIQILGPVDSAGRIEPPVSIQPDPVRVKQPYDVFLVLDVEATCAEGSDFKWPNEIIEWPVCLMRWKDKDTDGAANQLEIAAEFRSFVRPTWKPNLTQFCTSLTGITQKQVDRAPVFTDVITSFTKFLWDNGLIHPETGERLVRFCWCTDGPFDIRDFVIKQCFISKVPLPDWIIGDVMDVRRMVTRIAYHEGRKRSGKKSIAFPKRLSLNLTAQLRFLNLAPFIGRQHSGIDDTRNISRIVSEMARRGVKLEPNTSIQANRRWEWMGKPGEILEEYLQ